MSNSIKRIYQGKIISLNLEEVYLPNNTQETFEVVRHPGGAAVVVLDERNNVCLLKQYRHVVNEWLWELPAGKIDDSENPAKTARRELLEEAGVTADQWHSLGEVISSPGVFTEKIYLYLASNIQITRVAHEKHEIIEVHWVPFEKACSWALSGVINDSKTIVGLLRARESLND